MPNAGLAHDWAMCVLDPFGHAGAPHGVPDTYAGHSVVIESRGFFSFNSDGKFTYLFLNPAPGSHLWHYNNATSISDMDAVSWTVDTGLTFTQTQFGDNISRWRAMSLGFKLTPTGPTQARGGDVTVARVPIDVSNMWTLANTATPPVTTQYFTFANQTTARGALVAQTTTRVYTGSQTLTGAAVRKGGTSWEWQELRNNGIPVAGRSDTALNPYVSDAVYRMDPDWNGILIVVNGTGLTTQNFILETVLCVEGLALTTSILKTLESPSPPHHQPTLEAVANVQRTLPAAAPEQGDHSWGSLVRGALTGLGRGLLGLVPNLVGGVARMVLGPGVGGAIGRVASGVTQAIGSTTGLLAIEG